ncbi:F0F1-type ATP synthase subunit epsilon [Candidatus Carsonella ruddii]|uniref:Putative F0F1-type ATP synthase epsilon subunit n=1 Tax=Candidatus Carsonella ruddii PC isolate NHV TaxID=1202540 RepID=J3TEM2_CARRU|nr:F0F1-type ATP synthase subunit epsilon [Candidatus Carsonella ruddii]AFP84237.1 putative F0F1-type ATP synthase epsilon subunit [Candidatus Carsonella ruddii PC isolate NHV]
MNLLILCIKNIIEYNNIYLINVKTNLKFFTIMNNHIINICNINKIKLTFKNKSFYIKINNGFLFQKKKNITIICDFYEFL